MTSQGDMIDGGAQLPLGSGREIGGHKGYCLASMVDILCCVLSGANWGPFPTRGSKARCGACTRQEWGFGVSPSGRADIMNFRRRAFRFTKAVDPSVPPATLPLPATQEIPQRSFGYE